MRRWQFIVICICLVTIPALFALRYLTSTAVTGTITTKTKATQSPVRPTNLVLKTSLFTTMLPAGFRLKSQTETSANPSTQLRLVADTNAAIDQQFAATFATLPPGGLSAVGDYQLRKSAATIYTPAKLSNLPTDAVAFQSIQTPASITVFWLHDGHYLELAFSTSGGATLDQLNTTYLQVMRVWKWLM